MITSPLRFRFGNPVEDRLSPSLFVPETRIRFPFKYAPAPRSAENSSCRTGSYTTPAIASPARYSPSVTLNIGKPCAKFVVPSSGSTYQRYSEAFSCPPPSSATMACDGKCVRSRSTTSFSEARPASVTRSNSPFSSKRTRRSKYVASSPPASRAISAAVSRYPGTLAVFPQVLDIVLEHEQVRLALARQADEGLVVVLDGPAHFFPA